MKKYFKNIITLQLISLLLAGATACSKSVPTQSPKPTPNAIEAKKAPEQKAVEKQSLDKNLIQLSIKVASPVKLTLENYNGGFFTVKKPKGWAIETTGNYETFGFRMYDSEAPARQIFYYGSMSPVIKSVEAKHFWKQYVQTGGYGQAKMYGDAPVLAPATTERFFSIFNEFATFATQYGIKHNFPSLKDFKALETVKRNSPMASAALDDSIVRGLFTQSGVPCQGLFGATVVDSIKYPVNNLDSGYYTLYAVTGISAPTDEFNALESILSEAIGSFQLSQSYINQAVQQNQWETNAALKVGKTLSEANDSYNKAWHSRQAINDASAQKFGDSTLGYDRLYDTETGKTYRAEYGFWDKYRNNKEDYNNPNLEMVPSNSYDLLNKSVDGYIMSK
jgi:hypothetical protein